MKHFTYDDRLLIQRGLTLSWSFHALHLRLVKTELPSAERSVPTFIMAAKNLPGADVSSDMNVYSTIRLSVRHQGALKEYALFYALNVLCTVTDMNLKYALSFSSHLMPVMAVGIVAAIIASLQQGCILLIMLTRCISRLYLNPDSVYRFLRKSYSSSQTTLFRLLRMAFLSLFLAILAG